MPPATSKPKMLPGAFGSISQTHCRFQIYHCLNVSLFFSAYSLPETLVYILFDSLQQPFIFLIPKLQRFSTMLRRHFQPHFSYRKIDETYVLSEFEVFAWLISFLPLHAVISVCVLTCAPHQIARSSSAKTRPYKFLYLQEIASCLALNYYSQNAT